MLDVIIIINNSQINQFHNCKCRHRYFFWRRY